MADLLECLLQIKGLRESVNRLSTLAAEAAGRGGTAIALVAGVAAGLVVSERRWLAALGHVLPEATGTADRGAPADDAADDPVDVFRRARSATVTILDRCTAADLSASMMLPGLGRVTVADIVAHMLANDTERLGELRAALPRA